MTRGRKPVLCLDYDGLKNAYARDPRLAIVARAVAANQRQVRRWLGEIGIHVAVQPQVVSDFGRIVTLPDGRRQKIKLYKVWEGMSLRCNYPKQQSYKYYGAKGVKVCAEWDDYAVFREWAIANGYRKGVSIERRDTSGDYSPANCCWLPRDEQQFNTGRTHRLTHDGVTRSLPEWARIAGVSAGVFRGRLALGWTHAQIITTPKYQHRDRQQNGENK